MPQQQRAQPTPWNRLKKGTEVIVRGLQSKPHLNGSTGSIESYIHAKDRYNVKINGTTSMALKPDNLVQQVANLTLHNVSKTELNGKTGKIVGWTEDSSRYHVSLSTTGQAVALQGKNLSYPAGTVVKVHSLKGAPQHNGKWGVVTSFDASAGRHAVKLDQGGNTQIRLKPDNIAV